MDDTLPGSQGGVHKTTLTSDADRGVQVFPGPPPLQTQLQHLGAPGAPSALTIQ